MKESMQYVVCAVLDAAVGAFNRPFFVQSTGVAVRSFRDEVNRAEPDNPMHRHPDDFTLYNLGTWDDSNARFTPVADPEVLARAKDLKE